MSYKLSQIVHETPSHFVLKLGQGHYEVYQNGVTHSTKKATIHFSNKPEYAFNLAAERCDKLSASFQI